jgi:hypothetical protein
MRDAAKNMVAGALAALALGALANPAHNQISGLDEGTRAAVFAKLLRSGGERCPSVTRTFYQGSSKGGDAHWNVQCSDGKAWSVMVYNNATGSTRYVACDLLKAMNAGQCFRKFPEGR